jgi:hypothetical protein
MMIGRIRFLLAALFILSLGQAASMGQEHNSGTASAAGAAMSFAYKFENQRFYIPVIEVDLGPDGAGEVRFKRGESDEVIDLKLKASPQTMERIRQLVASTDFIASEEDYQSKKDFSHMGWMTLAARLGGRVRTARFNYTHNIEIKELSEIFHGLATQEIHLFDIENARQYQPLDLPKQIEVLESSLRLGRLAEPERVLGTLEDIAGDNTLLLIARNHAGRIIKEIKKGKYKGPIKK